MGETLLRKVTTSLGVLACLLQVASVVSPGWIIYIRGNIEEHHSLFYKLTCNTLMNDRNCEVKSFHTLHSNLRARLVKAGVGPKKIASVDFEYHTRVCKQVLIVIASCLTICMAASQIIQTIQKKSFVRLKIFSAASATTSAGIVLAVVFNDIVHVNHQMELQKLDGHRDHTYVGFPYCLGMLLGSAILLFVSICTISPQLYTPKPTIKVKKALPPLDDDDEEMSTPYVAPVTKLTEIPQPTYGKGNDNPVFSEKLTEIPKPTYDKGNDNPVFSEKL